MDRRESLKTLFLGSFSIPFLNRIPPFKEPEVSSDVSQQNQVMESNWSQWPDMEWVGPGFWGNRLQDWQIRNGKVRCSVTAPNRTLYCLTHQVNESTTNLNLSVNLELLVQTNSPSDRVGFRVGAKAQDDPVPVVFEDYRRDAIFGQGLDAGIQTDGHLFIGNQTSEDSIDLNRPIQLTLSTEEMGNSSRITLTALNREDGAVLNQLSATDIDPNTLIGNLALLANFQSEQTSADSPSVLFSDWVIFGDQLHHAPNQTFGPICFSQYTLNRGTMKMTTQLAPVESIEDHNVELQVLKNENWTTLQTTTVDPLSRTAHFRQENWEADEDLSYRVRLELPLKNGIL